MSEQHPTVEYRLIPTFPEYQIGDDGSLWSKYQPGTHAITGEWYPRKWAKSTAGYPHVVLSRDKKLHGRFIHRLVLEAFVGPCPAGMEGRHLDGNKHNARLSNLEWSTHVDNEADKVRHGTLQAGDRQVMSVLREADVKDILALYDTGKHTQVAIATKYGVSSSTICGITRGRSWRHSGNRGVGRDVRRGSNHHVAKLDEAAVLKAFKLYKQGYYRHEIGLHLGVSVGAIQSLLLRNSWQHVQISESLLTTPEERHRRLGQRSHGLPPLTSPA